MDDAREAAVPTIVNPSNRKYTDIKGQLKSLSNLPPLVQGEASDEPRSLKEEYGADGDGAADAK